MKRKWLQNRVVLLGFSLMAMHGCGSAPQVSGIVAITNIETVACQPRKKTLQIRNNNNTESQRVQGVLFELGTNDDKYYKILDVVANGQEKQAVGNLVEEIVLPPGGFMNVNIQYNPKETTGEGEWHDTYLDVVLNGPKLGVMQIEIRGTAPTSLEGCGATQGDLQVFTVDKINVTIKADGLPGGEFTNEIPGSEIPNPFQFALLDGVATMTPEDFPELKIVGDAIPLPNNELPVVLPDETQGTFDGAELVMDPFAVKGGGVIDVSGILTTGNAKATGTTGNISIDLTGSPLSADGKMKVVFVGALPNGVPAPELEGGVVGAEFELTQQ